MYFYIDMNNAETYMRRCFQLALGGLGNVAPNPLVGCVIEKDGKIIGEGFHRAYGGAHAEINAIESVKDKALLHGATLYVNLEPCTHFGKTPPCVDRIIESKIGKVVIAAQDPSDKVAGSGVAKLKNAGIEVVENVMKEEELELNRRFRTFHTKKRPYVILKWAQSLDGFIDKKRGSKEKGQFRISNEASRQIVHKWRSEEQGILIGVNTAIIDNPTLNVREVEGKNPLRMLIDLEGRAPKKLNLFTDGLPTLVFGVGDNKKTVEYIPINRGENVPGQIMNELFKKEMLSLIVEGGKNTIEAFIRSGVWDEARIIYGSEPLGAGLRAPEIEGEVFDKSEILDNRLTILRNVK